MAKGALFHDAGALTVTVPMTFRKRGGRKLVIAPNGADAWALPRARIDNTMVKALARAHRWKKQLDSGRFQTVQDLAETEIEVVANRIWLERMQGAPDDPDDEEDYDA